MRARASEFMGLRNKYGRVHYVGGELLVLGGMRLRNIVLRLIVGATSFTFVACSSNQPGSDSAWMTRVPNTERVSGDRGAMYVSPGAEWITFFESIESYMTDGLSSYEVATGRTVRHNLDRLPPSVVKSLGSSPFALMEGLGEGSAGWYDGKFYLFQAPRAQSHLTVVNADSAITQSKRPRERLMVVDGPSLQVLNGHLKERLGLQNATNYEVPFIERHSAAWHDGRYGNTTYAFDSDRGAIVAREPGREDRKITGLPGGGLFEDAHVSILRVSPDENFLAYVVGFHSVLVPTPNRNDILKVVDLTSGRTRSICSFRIIRSVYWSTDGKRIFLVGYDSLESRGVYIADFEQVLGAS